MSEFELTVLQKGEIKFDLEEAKKRISERTADFGKMVVTEDTIKDAKEIRATLNKERTAFDSERKAVKKEYEKPLKDFENKVKEVLSYYDVAIENIDKQLKAFDQERIKEKQEHLKQLYDENIGEYAEFIPFEKVKKPQWDNATYSDNDILHDISAERTKIMADLDVLKALDSEIYDKLIEKYKKSGNVLAEAIKANTDYIQAKSLAEKRVAEEQDEKKALFEWDEKKAAEIHNDFQKQKRYATFTIGCQTEEESEKLKQFLNFNDITDYSVIY